MNFSKFNTKQIGNVGLSYAIAYFASQGYCVSLPLNDSQDYDLIADIQGHLKTIQVKTTSQIKSDSESYFVELRSISGSSRKEYKTLITSAVDFLFVVTELCDLYLVPVKEITVKTGFTLNSNYIKYKVTLDS